MPHPTTIPEICAALTQRGHPDLAKRIAYFASDEDLGDGGRAGHDGKRVGILGVFQCSVVRRSLGYDLLF